MLTPCIKNHDDFTSAHSPCEYRLADVSLVIPDAKTGIFSARISGPENAPVWARAWLSNAIEGAIVEAVSDELNAGDEVEFKIRVDTESAPELACIRIESAPLETRQTLSCTLEGCEQYFLENLILKLTTREEALENVNQMPEEMKAEVSDDWLQRIKKITAPDPWLLGFEMIRRHDKTPVGSCGFKGPPDDAGAVEIAYGVMPEFEGQGYATEAAKGLTRFAFGNNVETVVAHTLPESNASTRVLIKCGFEKTGEVVDPDDGPVWRWERHKSTC